jgi:hypothetical protein
MSDCGEFYSPSDSLDLNLARTYAETLIDDTVSESLDALHLFAEFEDQTGSEPRSKACTNHQ